jgi:hypothetical protein
MTLPDCNGSSTSGPRSRSSLRRHPRCIQSFADHRRGVRCPRRDRWRIR